jgi:tape measure domain-containing protein
MANVTTELKVLVKTAGNADLDKLSRTLNGLGRQAKSAAAPFNQISKQLKDVQSKSKSSIANLQGYRNAWRDIAEQVEIGSKEFKKATAEAAKLDKQLAKVQGRRQTGGRLRGAVGVVGATAAAGVFGGPEGALGALAGGVIGGPAGAAIGGAIGAQVGALRQASGATAEYSANLSKLRVALKGVTTSQAEYQEGLQFIQQTTKDFAIPQEVVTRQFTKLQASVQGAGGNLEDAKTAFNGIVAAVRATGGSLADVDSALTATAQVFSKGKVSAEELRQQIGERLPGAFTLFAESMGKTPAELDKALEQGQVSLQDFQKFAEAIFERYGENAKTIASGPESAGDRLKVVLEQLSENVGTLLEPIGAAFQNTFTKIVEFINIAIERLNIFLGRGVAGLSERIKTLQGEVGVLDRYIRAGGPLAAGYKEMRDKKFAELLSAQDELNMLTEGADVAQPDVGTGLPRIVTEDKPARAKAARKLPNIYRDAERSFKRYFRELQKGDKVSQQSLTKAIQTNALLESRNEIERINTQFAIDTSNAIKKYQDFLKGNITEQARLNAKEALSLELSNAKIVKEKQLQKIATDAGTFFGKNAAKQKKELTEIEKLYESIGSTIEQNVGSALEGLIFQTQSLQESMGNLLRDVARLFLQFGTKTLFGAMGFADGGVFAQNGVVPFARGGIVNKPTLFPFAKGIGLMGEAGAEAIMPLKRGPSGRLGVEASGGGTSVVVNVDAKGTQVQGSDNRGKALGSAISAAIQAELVRQKRPGGLLA